MHLNQKHPKIFYGWWVVVACLLITLYVGGVIRFGFTAIFEPIASEFGWSYTKVSLAASLRSLVMGLLAPLMGFLVDRWGPRKLIFLGTFIIGLGMMFLSRISSLAMFYAAFVLISIGLSTCSLTVLGTAVVNWFRRRVGIATGIMISGIGLGGLMVRLVTILTDTFEWRTAMLTLGLSMLVLGMPLSLVIRHKPEQYGYLPDGEVGNLTVVNERSSLAKSSQVNITARQALAGRAFWHIALSSMFHSFVVGAVVIHIMPYFSSIGIVRATSSLVAMALPLVSAFGRLSFGWLGDRINKKWAATIAFALMSLGLFFLGYIPITGAWLIPIFIVFFGIGWGGNVTIRIGLLREYFGRSRFGTILGFTSSVMMLGNMGGVPLAGWAFDKWGSYQGIWFIFSTLTLAGLVLILSIPASPDST